MRRSPIETLKRRIRLDYESRKALLQKQIEKLDTDMKTDLAALNRLGNRLMLLATSEPTILERVEHALSMVDEPFTSQQLIEQVQKDGSGLPLLEQSIHPVLTQLKKAGMIEVVETGVGSRPGKYKRANLLDPGYSSIMEGEQTKS